MPTPLTNDVTPLGFETFWWGTREYCSRLLIFLTKYFVANEKGGYLLPERCHFDLSPLYAERVHNHPPPIGTPSHFALSAYEIIRDESKGVSPKSYVSTAALECIRRAAETPEKYAVSKSVYRKLSELRGKLEQLSNEVVEAGTERQIRSIEGTAPSNKGKKRNNSYSFEILTKKRWPKSDNPDFPRRPDWDLASLLSEIARLRKSVTKNLPKHVQQAISNVVAHLTPRKVTKTRPDTILVDSREKILAVRVLGTEFKKWFEYEVGVEPDQGDAVASDSSAQPGEKVKIRTLTPNEVCLCILGFLNQNQDAPQKYDVIAQTIRFSAVTIGKCCRGVLKKCIIRPAGPRTGVILNTTGVMIAKQFEPQIATAMCNIKSRPDMVR